MSKLIATIGIPGSGKSHWAKEYAAQSGYEIVSLDSIRFELGDISDQTKNYSIYLQSSERVRKYLNSGVNVIFDSTGLYRGFYRKIKKLVEDTSCEVEYKIFFCDPEVAKQRVHQDIVAGKNRADVPDKIIDRMYKMFLARKYEKE